MITVRLICHTERAPHLDSQDASLLGFSLNLSTAFEDADLPPASADLGIAIDDYLQPWNWAWDADDGTGVKRPRILAAAINPTTHEVVKIVPVLGTGFTLGTPPRDTWVAQLEDRLSEVKGANPDKRNFVWPPSGGNDITYDGNSPENFETVRQWAVEQTQLFLEPAPLPQEARLSRYFWVKTGDIPAGFEELTAAPIFQFTTVGDVRTPAWLPPVMGGPAPVTDPIGDFTHAGEPLHEHTDAPLTWGYIPVDGAGNPLEPKVAAFLNRAPVARQGPWAAGGLWEGGWVKVEDAVYGEDWLAELEERAAELFDLPGLLVRFLGQVDPAQRDDALAAFRSGFELALRDLVQTGSMAGNRTLPGAPPLAGGAASPLPQEIGLAGDVMRAMAREAGKVDDRGVIDAGFLAGANEALEVLHEWETVGSTDLGLGVAPAPTLGAWWQSVLARVWQPPAGVAGNQVEIDKLKDFAVLRAWYSHVTQEDVARGLMLEQWDLLLNNNTRKTQAAAWWRDYGTLARRDIFPKIQVRRQESLMHLGVRWRQMLTDIGRAPSGDRRTPEEFAQTLGATLANRILEYLQDRGTPVATHFKDLPRIVAPAVGFMTWQGLFATWLRPQVQSVVREKILAGAVALADLGPSLQPDAVVLHLSDVSAADGRVEDPHDGIAGFGVLLQETGKAPECITLVDLHLATDSHVFKPGVRPDSVQVGVTVAPVRPTVRNGVRRALVSYNNEPVTAESPVLNLAQNYPLEAQKTLAGKHRVRLFNPYKAGGPHLPALRFGQEYRAAAFVVGIGGTLPPLVSDPNDRTRYAPQDDLNMAPRWSQPFRYLRRVSVGPLRMESSRELKKLGGKLDLPPIPPSVHPLASSLRELAESRSATAAAAMAADPDASNQARVDMLDQSAEDFAKSLILLRPPGNPGESGKPRRWEPVAAARFEFKIQRPTLDLRVWDRTFEFTSGAVANAKLQRERAQRQQVWRDTFKAFKDNPGASPGSDATLDDPAVEQLYVQLRRVFPLPDAAAPEVVVEKVIPFTLGSGTGGLAGERASALQAVVLSVDRTVQLAPGSEILAPGDPDPQAPGASTVPLRIKVREGEVWELQLAPLVPADPFQTWFQEKLWNFTFVPWTDPGTMREYRIAAPRIFTVEVATAQLPAPSDVLRALLARAVAGGQPGPVREPWSGAPLVVSEVAGVETLRANWRVEAALDPSVFSDPSDLARRETFHWLHHVTVLMQRWRWNGRPLRDAVSADEAEATTTSGFRPWTATAFFEAWNADDAAQLEAWDGRMFGDRAGTDYRRHEATVDFTAGGGPEAGASRIFHQDISQDPAAAYFRFAVQVRSRYEGLLRHVAIESREGKPDVPEAWRRLVVPCRFDKEVPPPRVKLVLPLTDTRETGEGEMPETTPGLLVVLAEPWFLYGGLAEDLTAEVMTAEEPIRFTETPPPQPSRRAELGGDPIMVATPDPAIIVPPGDGFTGAFSFEPLETYGPIGYTFDTDTLAPEFIHTSFVVPAPVLQPLDESSPVAAVRDLSWYFVKMRFRRRIEAAGMALPLASTESEATAGIWAQFLPPSSRFATNRTPGDWVEVSSLSLQKATSAGKTRYFIAEASQPGSPVPLRPTPVQSAVQVEQRRFQLWALVTEPLFDAYGNQTQERFMDFCHLDDDGFLVPHILDQAGQKSALDRAEKCRVRIVEMQVLPGQEELIRQATTPLDAHRFLFPSDPERTHQKEALARCVRVSPPIGSPRS